eukprot:scaffold260029_cov28-Tisochrysis_lutea.AAC.1
MGARGGGRPHATPAARPSLAVRLRPHRSLSGGSRWAQTMGPAACHAQQRGRRCERARLGASLTTAGRDRITHTQQRPGRSRRGGGGGEEGEGKEERGGTTCCPRPLLPLSSPVPHLVLLNFTARLVRQ